MPRALPATLGGFAIVALSICPVAAQTGSYQAFGDSGGFLNIVPPGQDGVLNAAETLQAQLGTWPPHVLDQLSMYGDLVYNSPGLTEDRILEFFKDASFGVREDDIERSYSPTAGVTILRDRGFGVPHIFGETRHATMFGQGYATAEDRLFLMDLLRHVGRARMTEFLGPSQANLKMDREQLAVAPYTEADLTAQLEAIRNGTPEGPALEQDLLSYIAGVNAYVAEARLDPAKRPVEYEALQILLEDFVPEDVVAIAALVGGIFGKGGGGELLNHCGLQAMTAELGSAAAARSVFDDFRFADDPEAPTTSRTPTPYMLDLGPVDPDANPDIDCASLVPIDDGAGSVTELLAGLEDGLSGLGLGASAMSNAMLISAEHTKGGRPIAVFGPQTSYYMPQLLVEKDVHGPGIDARGVAFAGTDLYVQLGRGRDYAWSATSAGGDLVDQFVLRLCEPGGGTATTSSMGYLRSGVCEPIETFEHVQIAKPTAGGLPGGLDLIFSWRVERTVHYGPLVARGRLTDGTPIAVATLRSTYRNELGSAVGFSKINNPDYMADGYPAFRRAMGEDVDYTFNWFYIDAEDIAYQHSCLCPKRAQGVDPDFPAWGDGRFDWNGFLTLAEQPSALNPPEGYLTSWNNKQAPGFRANDRNFSYGPTYRSTMFDVRVEPLVEAGATVRTDMIDAMEDAGTCDLRGQDVLPVVLDVLGETPPVGSDPRAAEMRDRLADWVESGSHRRDFDADGEYDDPQAPAILDAWWPRLSRAIFDEGSGHAFDHLRLGFDDGNRRGHIGSAFQDGSYGLVLKDLRQVLGMPVSGSLSRIYCGGGSLAACRDLLWESLSAAAADLEAEFADPSPENWKRAVADEDVRHTAAGVNSVPAIHWINRPTFQQVVQVGSTQAFACAKSRSNASPVGVTVEIGGELGDTAVTLGKAEALCEAAEVDDGGIADAGARLACFQAKTASGRPRHEPGAAVLRSSLGAGTVSLSTVKSLCLAATVDAVSAETAVDARECFRAKFTGAAAPRTFVTVEDSTGRRRVETMRLDSVCLPASVGLPAVADASSELACFRTRRARGENRFVPRDAAVGTQLGSGSWSLLRDGRLCVPAAVALD